uniref:DUF642 domain-containing protein n=1 Tax=Setaria italica TaxID=4555 RepID=K3YD92_SETIT
MGSVDALSAADVPVPARGSKCGEDELQSDGHHHGRTVVDVGHLIRTRTERFRLNPIGTQGPSSYSTGCPGIMPLVQLVVLDQDNVVARSIPTTGPYAIPHWEISGYVEYIGSGQKQGDMLLPVPEGAYAAEQLDVTVAPESDILPIQTVYTSSGWDSYSWAFKATCSVVLFIVHNPGVSEDPACGPLIDLFAIKTLPPPKSSKNNMRKNGDFEEGPYIFRNTPWGVLVPPMDEDDYSPLSPWMVMSSTKSVKFVDAPHHVVPHGARAVELVSGVETALVQDVGTVAGLPYRLEFSAGDAGDGCAGAMTVQAYAGRGSVRVPDQSQGKGGHKRGVLEFTAIANQTRVVFISMAYNMKGDGTLCGPVVDDVSFVCTRKHGARRVLL